MKTPTQMELRDAYQGKRVLLTGHTGFKGSWLTLWLRNLGADVTGFSLAPDTKPALFEAAGIAESCRHLVGDIRIADRLLQVFRDVQPEYVFHLAAQPLVRRSYEQPLETIQTNVLGTTHVLEAVRRERRPCAVVVVTSDKCYENREWIYGYREIEPLGGHDVYSMSKAAAEFIVSSYRRSFFGPQRIDQHGVAIASARAGNVLGGGDWAKDRIVPDSIVAIAERKPIVVRNPDGMRPWQHVLEPLGGYLLLGARLAGVGTGRRADFCDAWNFGPRSEDARSVSEVVQKVIETWGEGTWAAREDPAAPHEAGLLRLCTEKAQANLGWVPRWSFDHALRRTVEWYRVFYGGASTSQLRALCLEQIREYMES